MDELAYARYIQNMKQQEEKAREIYKTIRELYGWETPWKKSYFMAIKDKLLSKEDKDIVKEFYPVK